MEGMEKPQPVYAKPDDQGTETLDRATMEGRLIEVTKQIESLQREKNELEIALRVKPLSEITLRDVFGIRGRELQVLRSFLHRLSDEKPGGFTIDEILRFKMVRRGSNYGTGPWFAVDKDKGTETYISRMGDGTFNDIQKTLAKIGVQIDFEDQSKQSRKRLAAKPKEE